MPDWVLAVRLRSWVSGSAHAFQPVQLSARVMCMYAEFDGCNGQVQVGAYKQLCVNCCLMDGRMLMPDNQQVSTCCPWSLRESKNDALEGTDSIFSAGWL